MINLIYSVNQFKFDMVGMIWITNPCYVAKWKLVLSQQQQLINISFREGNGHLVLIIGDYGKYFCTLMFLLFTIWYSMDLLTDFRITTYYKSSWPLLYKL